MTILNIDCFKLSSPVLCSWCSCITIQPYETPKMECITLSYVCVREALSLWMDTIDLCYALPNPEIIDHTRWHTLLAKTPTFMFRPFTPVGLYEGFDEPIHSIIPRGLIEWSPTHTGQRAFSFAVSSI